MLRFIILGILGAIPGLVVACYQLRIGLGWAFAGSCLGLLFALPSVTFSRTVRLAFAMIVGRHIPGATEHLAPKAEELSVEHQEINDRVFDWLAGKDVEERNAWIVLAGAVFGVIVTVVVAIHYRKIAKTCLWLGTNCHFLLHLPVPSVPVPFFDSGGKLPEAVAM